MKRVKKWLLGLPNKNVHEYSRGTFTWACYCSNSSSNVHKTEEGGSNWSRFRLHSGQTNGGRGSQAACCGNCVRATVCVPSAVAYSLLLPERQVNIYLQVELRSPFYCSLAFRYFNAVLAKCRLTKQTPKCLSSAVRFLL